MIKACGILTGAVLCLATTAVTPTSTNDDRQLRDLAKRVEKLERSTDETNKKLEALTKAVSDLKNTVGSGRSSNSNARDLAARIDSNEQKIRDIGKSVEQLNRFMADMQKQSGPKGESISASFKRCDDRIKKLAEWIDEYHPRKNVAHYHRDEVERIK